MNVVCCFGCFGCTKLGCYNDGDEVKYYGAEERAQAQNGQLSPSQTAKRINGSFGDSNGMKGIAEEEKENAKLLAGPKA